MVVLPRFQQIVVVGGVTPVSSKPASRVESTGHSENGILYLDFRLDLKDEVTRDARRPSGTDTTKEEARAEDSIRQSELAADEDRPRRNVVSDCL